jgi:mono/diheme cytochrome c family protein
LTAAFRVAARQALALAAAAVLLTPAAPTTAAAGGDARRGEYVARLSGCHSCHTDSGKKGAPLAGGLELKSPFGIFRVPNITPDPDTGIGRWSERDFIRAMTQGVAPGGAHYYPAFPYTSYTRMTQPDLLDLKAYLDTVKPVRHAVPPHELRFPYSLRFALGLWKWLFFRPGPFKPDPAKSPSWNRGAYLATGPGHCGECHTARNFLGALRPTHAFAGARQGPDGNRVPNITPHPEKGIGLWSAQDIVDFLKTGKLPYGEEVGPPMDEVIANNTSHWSDADLKATAEFLLSLPKQETP